MRFEGKAVIVTGAAQGIGRAVAERFHAEGASVLIADMAGAEEAAAEVSTSNLPAFGVTSTAGSPDGSYASMTRSASVQANKTSTARTVMLRNGLAQTGPSPADFAASCISDGRRSKFSA